MYVDTSGQPEVPASEMSSTYFETGPLIGLNSPSRLGWLVREPQGVSAFPALGLKVLAIAFGFCPGFLCAFWGLKSGSHTCEANSLPTEPSPQL